MGSYVLAKYIRLSSEDFDNGGDKAESNSVVNQRTLLDDFIRRIPDFTGCEVLEFCDDGWSGTNFNRPAVKALLEQAQRGNIHCIVVKDLSRFGRNHIEAGDFLEQIFPAWGVRFISVNDEYDSQKYRGATGGIDISLRNLVYDIYSKDLSAKVRSARKSIAKQGHFTSPFAFYGYIKDQADRHRLLMDEEAAAVVRRIFDMAESGLCITEIARMLNGDGVPTPQMRQQQNGTRRKWNMVGERNFWDPKRVRLILNDERYTGTLVSGRFQRPEVGGKNVKLVPKEDWIAVPDVLPIIITQEQYDRVQKLVRSDREQTRSVQSGETVFCRKIRCGVCRKAMHRGNTSGKNRTYSCRTKQVVEDCGCASDTIRESVITDIVLQAIRQQALFADRAKKQLERKSAATMSDAELCQREISRLRTDLRRTEQAKLILWENKGAGRIAVDVYLAEKEKLSREIESINAEMQGCQAKLVEMEMSLGRENRFVQRFRQHTGIQRLTRTIVDELVDAVYVYDREHIEIIWNYRDEYMALLAQLENDSLGA